MAEPMLLPRRVTETGSSDLCDSENSKSIRAFGRYAVAPVVAILLQVQTLNRHHNETRIGVGAVRHMPLFLFHSYTAERPRKRMGPRQQECAPNASGGIGPILAASAVAMGSAKAVQSVLAGLIPKRLL